MVTAKIYIGILQRLHALWYQGGYKGYLYPPCFIPSCLLSARYISTFLIFKYINRDSWTTSIPWKPTLGRRRTKSDVLEKRYFTEKNWSRLSKLDDFFTIYFLLFHLIHFLLCYFCLPTTVSGKHVRTVRTGSYAPVPWTGCIIISSKKAIINLCPTSSKWNNRVNVPEVTR